MCYIRNETGPEGDLSYMSTTAKERFDQMMERSENLLRASDKSEVKTLYQVK